MLKISTLLILPAAGWLLISIVFFALGEYWSKKWALSPTWYTAVMVGVIYGIGGVMWLPALLHKNELAVMGTIWEVLAVCTTIIIGLFIFREHLSFAQYIGLVFR